LGLKSLKKEVLPTPGLSPGFYRNIKINRALAHNIIPMAFVKNWLHCVWGTKNRIPYMTDNIRKSIIDHIIQNSKSKGIYIKSLNGQKEHIHCLLSLNPDKSLSEVIQLIKGESSYWINKQKLTRLKFEWAVEYYAVSVSENQIRKVINYIKNQEEHHKKKTWEEEYNEFIEEYGL
jgi:REP element-mobilizing transposase RayT